jgi:hypothetical protein
MADNKNSNNQNKAERESQAKPHAMTPEEAGHLGGEKGGKAPHECRGSGCHKQGKNK